MFRWFSTCRSASNVLSVALDWRQARRSNSWVALLRPPYRPTTPPTPCCPAGHRRIPLKFVVKLSSRRRCRGQARASNPPAGSGTIHQTGIYSAQLIGFRPTTRTDSSDESATPRSHSERDTAKLVARDTNPPHRNYRYSRSIEINCSTTQEGIPDASSSSSSSSRCGGDGDAALFGRMRSNRSPHVARAATNAASSMS